MHEALFTPVKLGAITAPNRILMAPLTRARSNAAGIPNALMAEYYAQRAAAGLLITEATGISREGLGWPDAPGIWTAEQVEGWKLVTDAVHQAGGRIICQLWHMGRLVSSTFLDGAPPVSASATKAPDYAHTYRGELEFDLARPLELGEIPRLLDDYAAAARNAIAAGFDGVQLHAANGYLIDQFLRDGTNLRDDDYGGPVANRCRLLKEVTERLTAEVGAGRVSVRLSPNDDIQGVADSDKDSLFAEAARTLEPIGIGFLELREPAPGSTWGTPDGPSRAPLMKQFYTGPLVHNGDYDATRADAEIGAGQFDAIAFGRPWIANPDLVERIRAGVPFADPGEPAQWYGGGAGGYTDWPAVVVA